MFPRISKVKENSISKSRLNFLKTSIGLDIDEDSCQGCGICVKVCPVDALGRGPIGAIKKQAAESKVDKHDLVPTVVDPTTCSYCGLCSYMCPWNSIKLMKDEQAIELDQLDIVVKKAVPQLEYKMFKCKKGVKDAKAYLEGDIAFNTKNCPGGCSVCVDVCPTEALKIDKPNLPWGKGRAIVVDKDKCISCGTCLNACPVPDAITLTIKEVKAKGSYNAIFWDRIVKDLKEARIRDGNKIK